MHHKKMTALSLLSCATLLGACGTTSEAIPSPSAQTVYRDRHVDPALFQDRGVPAIESVDREQTTSVPAALDVADLGEYLMYYRCKLNVAGVSLAGEAIRPIPGCLAFLEAHPELQN